MFAGGPLLLAAACPIGCACTRGAFREIVMMVFFGAWAFSIIAGVVAAKIFEPELEPVPRCDRHRRGPTLWVVLFWGVAAWRLRVAYKRAPRPAEQAAAA